MSNVYRFIYDSDVNDDSTEYPEATSVKVRHYISDGTTWPVILYQFAKFLETCGYEGVKEKVIIRDPYNVHGDCGFETVGPEKDDWVLDNEDKDAQ